MKIFNRDPLWWAIYLSVVFTVGFCCALATATPLEGSLNDLRQQLQQTQEPKRAVSSVPLGNIYINGQWYAQVAVTYSDGTTVIQRIPINTNQF